MGPTETGITNEDLAALIQQGEMSKIPELWQQVQPLVRMRAIHVLPAMEGRGVELDDLLQAGFLAVLDAVNRYDPNGAYAFTTYLSTSLKTEFAEASGYRSPKQRRDPLHKASSLDAPLDRSDGENSDTLLATVADPSDPYQDADERMYREQLHTALEEALDTLEDNQARTLRLRFYDELPRSDISKLLGVSLYQVNTLEQHGLSKLRSGQNRARLEQFVDAQTDFYRCGSARKQESPVEAAVIWREQLRFSGFRRTAI